MAQLPDKVCELYDRVPKECFIRKVPFCLRYFPDDTVIPAHSLCLRTADGERTKWVKVSGFKHFVQACRAYWTELSGSVPKDHLHVYVMPYIPLEDAFRLHQLIENADILPDSFSAAVEHLELRVNNTPTNWGTSALQMDLENKEEEASLKEKHGVLTLLDLSVCLKFVLVNYDLLWSKAESYCMLQFITDPLKEFLKRIEVCDSVLSSHDSSAELIEHLEGDVERSRRLLIFATYARDSPDADPHDSIKSMYPDLHDQIYHHCRHCDLVDEEDSPGTMERLDLAMNNLGFEDYQDDMSMEEAQYQLMIAEGSVEYQHCSTSALEGFADARQHFRNMINPILCNIVNDSRRPTLMGVIDDVEDDEDEMDTAQ